MVLVCLAFLPGVLHTYRPFLNCDNTKELSSKLTQLMKMGKFIPSENSILSVSRPVHVCN